MARRFYDRLIARGYTPQYLDQLYTILPERDALLQDLRARVQRRTETRQQSLDRNTNECINDSSVLVYVPRIYNRALHISWQRILALPPDITSDDDMCRAYDMDNLRIIVGAKNPKNAAYYLSRLRNLLPSPSVSSVVHTAPEQGPTVPEPNANAPNLRQTVLADFFSRR